MILVQVQLLSHVWLFATSSTAVCQGSLAITNSWSLLKLMSIELVMPSNHLILWCPLLLLPSVFPSIRGFSKESVLCQSIGVSASASVLAMNIQDWSPLGWTSWISLQSKALSRAFSNTTVHWVTKSWDNWSDLTQYTTFVKFLKHTARFAWDLSLGKIRISVW